MSRATRRYDLVALGGTFDILHAGHRELLSEAFRLSNKVVIGVTGDRLVTTLNKTHKVRPFDQRVRDLDDFLRKHRWSSRAQISELREPYGPAVRRKRLQALIVSKTTLTSGRQLNRLRRQKSLPQLELLVVDLLEAADGKPISTTRIRRRETDIEGRVVGTLG